MRSGRQTARDRVRRCRRTVAPWALLAMAVPSVATAQDTPPAGGTDPSPGVSSTPERGGTERGGTEPRGGTDLQTYMQALAERRLVAAETGSVERLRELVRRGEELFLDGRHHEASLALFEVAESPRFADFVELPEFRGAEYMLARALEQMGALRTAQRYLERILARGPDDLYFGPAYRKYVDVTLASGDLAGGIARLESLGVDNLPEDSTNELRYLRGRERYDADAAADADARFGEITRRSRFFASAQYLRGVIAARGGDLQEAENHFCTIAGTGAEDQYTFYVDGRFFEVQDLARLGLGRVAHEGGRSDDAFYYYFQVPNDSAKVAEALFESAYAMYEGGDYETAIDLLDQLEVRFPETSFADEAKLLRGYVHLGRCEFQEASELFVKFQQVFEPVRSEVQQILASPARQSRLYEELLMAERREVERAARGEEPEGSASTTRALLLAMLRVDPTFYRLHADVRTLDAEAARAGRLPTELAEIAARVSGRERPVAAAESEDRWDDVGDLRRDIDGARAILSSLTEQLDAMRGSAPADQTRPIEEAVRDISTRLHGLETQLAAAAAGSDTGESAAPEGDGVDALIRRDVRYAQGLRGRVAATRGRMVEAANEAALRATRDLARRLGAGLRRARIGRIDAVMGSKRRIEIQIESLAAGRFPAELQDPLRVQGLLRDDEEYWPFEGELWADEFDETEPIEELSEDE